jgi:hypothetical protein
MKVIHGIGLAGVATVGVLVLAASPASASEARCTVHVVAPGHSIQAAVNGARSGDTIVLRKGNYAGGILISKNNITIRGAGRETVLRDTGTNHCTDVAGPSGICVVSPSGTTVKSVTIKDLTVRGFAGFGVVGFGTDRLTVAHIAAINNGDYGITEFGSTRGAFIGNYVTGSSGEAGLYVGDIANAHGTIVKDNISVANALGILVRHAHNVDVTGNIFTHNCAGVALVDDGQAGGQGDTRVTHNIISNNNMTCPADEDHPELGGSGVIILGGVRDIIKGNLITGNRGTTPFAGGVVLEPGIAGNPAKHNKVINNVIKNNRPADIVNNSGSTTNIIKNNVCGTSKSKEL